MWSWKHNRAIEARPVRGAGWAREFLECCVFQIYFLFVLREIGGMMNEGDDG